MTAEEQAEKLQKFLYDTKQSFDKYFDHLGYVCFIFQKEGHKGESVYISNAPEELLPIVEPYANAQSIARAKINKNKLKNMRRVK